MSSEYKKADFPLTEYTTVKASYELINKRYRRNHRELEKTAALVGKSLDELTTATEVSKAIELLEKVAGVISGCKRKANSMALEELKLVLRAKRRIEHINDLSNHEKRPTIQGTTGDNLLGEERVKPIFYTKRSDIEQPNRTDGSLNLIRLHRHLADFLFANGYARAALKMAHDRSEVSELCLTELFEEAVSIEEALSRGDTVPAHNWIQEANFKLKKNESHFEFDLRVFEFYLLVRQGKRIEAIQHARKYMSSIKQPDEYRATKLGQAMILLAMRTPEELQTKAECNNLTETWIVKRAHEVILDFYSYPVHSPFQLIVNAGISAIKTHQCYDVKTQHQDCATCHPIINRIGVNLPFGRHDHSVLTCFQTGLIMDEHNPPMSLPNGYVYSQQGISELTGPDGMVTCPRSGERFDISKVQRVYIL